MDQAVLRTQKWLNSTYGNNSNYTKIPEDGTTGNRTIKALTTALQIELGISTPNGNFGPATSSAFKTLSAGSKLTNQVYILQGALFCKGYNPGGFTGNFADHTKKAVTQIQADAGLSTVNGEVNSLLMKSLLSMDAFTLLTYGSYNGNYNIRIIQQNLNKNYSSNKYFASNIGLVPCDGIYGRSTNKALLYALQIEEGISVPNGVFGPSTKSKCPVLSTRSANSNFIQLLKYALFCNNFDPKNFNTKFDNDCKDAVTRFQKFCCLSADGIAGAQTWASLLVSTGDKTRKGTMCDCSTTITEAKAKTLKDNGYKSVGRYLTGRYKMTSSEISTIFNAGLKIFPIFEQGGYQLSHFVPGNGTSDAKLALEAAKNFGFGKGTIIYFTVDFDALDGNVTTSILPYFKEIHDTFINYKSEYKIGIYGPRNVCSRVANAGYSCSSFVCDMSSGFSGNLGYPLPKDWAIDQISTITIGSGDGQIEIDNDISSEKNNGESYVTPSNIPDNVPNNVIIFQSKRSVTTDADGNKADDLKYNDTSKDELLKLNSLFKYQIDESYDPDILFSEFNSMCTSLFSTGEMENVILDMIEHFKDGTGTNYSNKTLTEHVINHESTKEYVDCIKSELIRELKANGGDLKSLIYTKGAPTPLYNYINANANRPYYNTISDKINGLTITIDDTWGNTISISDYSIKNNHFKGTLHFYIYDHFGLDQPDVEKIYVKLAGFRAWYVLQHYKEFNGKFKPYVTDIKFDIPFEGDLK